MDNKNLNDALMNQRRVRDLSGGSSNMDRTLLAIGTAASAVGVLGVVLLSISGAVKDLKKMETDTRNPFAPAEEIATNRRYNDNKNKRR